MEYSIPDQCSVSTLLFISPSPFSLLLFLVLRWWVGGWQLCTSMCGPTGVKKRTVLCVRTVAGEERVLHHADCRHMLKPKPVVPCNRDMPCSSDWFVGNWNEVGSLKSLEVARIY